MQEEKNRAAFLAKVDEVLRTIDLLLKTHREYLVSYGIAAIVVFLVGIVVAVVSFCYDQPKFGGLGFAFVTALSGVPCKEVLGRRDKIRLLLATRGRVLAADEDALDDFRELLKRIVGRRLEE